MSNSSTIAKNLSVLMVSQLITWVLTLLQTVFLPRMLGPAAMGQFYVAWSIWLIVSSLATFGMDTHMIKEIARDPQRAPKLLGTAVVIQFVLYLLGSVAVAIYLFFTKATDPLVMVSIGIAVLLGAFSTSLIATLQGLEVMEHVSIANVLSKLVGTTLTLSVLFIGLGIHAVALVSIVSGLIGPVFMALHLRRRYPLRLHFSLPDALAMLRASAPYLSISLTLVVYTKVDTLVMATLVDAAVIGWYSTAASLFGTLMFVPVMYMTAVFPALARSYSGTSSNDLFGRIASKSFNLLFIAGVPIALGTIVAANSVVSLLFGPEFLQVVPVLTTMSFVIIFTYLNTLFGYLFVSVDRPYIWTIVMAVAVVGTLLFDLFIIPWTQRVYGNGAIGGALSYLLAEMGMTVVGILILPRKTFSWSNVRTVVLAMVAGLAMAGVCWWWRDAFLAVPVALGAVVYTALIVLLRIVPQEDIALVTQVATQLFARVRARVGRPAHIGGD